MGDKENVIYIENTATPIRTITKTGGRVDLGTKNGGMTALKNPRMLFDKTNKTPQVSGKAIKSKLTTTTIKPPSSTKLISSIKPLTTTRKSKLGYVEKSALHEMQEDVEIEYMAPSIPYKSIPFEMDEFKIDIQEYTKSVPMWKIDPAEIHRMKNLDMTFVPEKNDFYSVMFDDYEITETIKLAPIML